MSDRCRTALQRLFACIDDGRLRPALDSRTAAYAKLVLDLKEAQEALDAPDPRDARIAELEQAVSMARQHTERNAAVAADQYDRATFVLGSVPVLLKAVAARDAAGRALVEALEKVAELARDSWSEVETNDPQGTIMQHNKGFQAGLLTRAVEALALARTVGWTGRAEGEKE